jgi:membrane-associated protease RseP (regulator of RpoE activity)
MRKTKRLRGFIDGVAQRNPRFWRIFMNIGIPISIFFMVFIVYALIISLQTLFQAPTTQLILPGVNLPGQAISVPFIQGIIGLATVIVIHEFGHGILARAEGVRIKSIGLLLLAVLPGAFVEPDEDDIKKSKKTSRLRIYAAGSIFNLTLAAASLLVMLLITLLFISSVYIDIPGVSVPGVSSLKTEPIGQNISGPIFTTFHSDGVKIDSVVPKSPAYGVLQSGMVIESINGYPINNLTQFEQVRSNFNIGETLNIQTNEGSYTLNTVANPNNVTESYIGISTEQNLMVNSNLNNIWGNTLLWIVFNLQDLLYWIFFLNFAVGIINLLPARPLDGGLIFEELLSYRISKTTVNRIVNGLSIFLWGILIVSIVYGTGRGILMLF